MTATTDIIPDAETRPLDFTALLAARSRALDLASRLEHGDRAAIPEARRLLDVCDLRQAAAAEAMRIAGITDVPAIDSVVELVCGLGYGDLHLWLDVIEGREEHPDAPDTEMLAFVAEHKAEIDAWSKRCEKCGR